MMKVLAVVDKEGTALDRLAKGVTEYHSNLDYKVLAVHPKRPDAKQLEDFSREAFDADIIDWQYFRTAEMLRAKFPWLKDKKQILTHNNPYSVEEQDWNGYDLNVGNNEYICDRLSKITSTRIDYVPITVDTNFWTFNADWQPNKNVIMVANRIESKKGILPVAIACAELNLHFILVGAISDPNYFQSILATNRSVEFHEQISDDELKELYYKSTIHVCNSVDNFESGTMPILEAMLTGVPVLTRNVGHVPELNNGENMVMLEGASDDVQGIQDKLLEMISSKGVGTADRKFNLATLRDKAWQTAKARSFERRAYQYQKLYRQVMYPDQQPVSVVVPIYDKPEIISKCLNAVANQTYKNIELIVANDNSDDIENRHLVGDFAQYVNIPVRYINTCNQLGVHGFKDYGLARARNEGTIEATGDIMVYCDQRMVMEPNCIEEFVKNLEPKTWLYGNKGGKKEFVENLSCIKRDNIIDFGLFSERMTQYGGLSQETRNRFKHQGGRTKYIETAKAIPTGKSSNRNRKRSDIIKSKNRLFKMGL
jgi:glycosyltransferase involved in cell wall biosynthesis